MKLFRNAIVLFLCLSSSKLLPVHAQEEATRPIGKNLWIISAGSLIPTGSFAAEPPSSIENIKSLIEQGGGVYGNAFPGLSLGFGALLRITPEISFFGTLDLYYNRYNLERGLQNWQKFYQAYFTQVFSSGSPSSITVQSTFGGELGAFWNSTVLAGVRYEIPLQRSLSVFVSAQAGILVGMIPTHYATMELVVETTTVFQRQSTRNDWVQSITTGLAGALGVGLQIGETFVIQTRFIASKPSYRVNIHSETTAQFGIKGLPNPTPPQNPSVLTQDISASLWFPTHGFLCTVGYIIPW